ncbi:hypothetical protein T265_15246, partial [Opisthorchis viverrini]
ALGYPSRIDPSQTISWLGILDKTALPKTVGGTQAQRIDNLRLHDNETSASRGGAAFGHTSRKYRDSA